MLLLWTSDVILAFIESFFQLNWGWTENIQCDFLMDFHMVVVDSYSSGLGGMGSDPTLTHDAVHALGFLIAGSLDKR